MKPTLVSGLMMLALTSVLGYHNIYRPHQARVQALEKQLIEQRQTQELREQVARSLEELERLEQQLPREPETEALVREISKLAEEAGVQLTSIIPQSPKPLRGFTHLSVQLQVVTSYHELGKFISVLENAKPFINIDELGLGQRDPSGSTQARMTVSTLAPAPGTSSSR